MNSKFFSIFVLSLSTVVLLVLSASLAGVQDDDSSAKLRSSKKQKKSLPNNFGSTQSLLSTQYIWSGLGATSEMNDAANWVGGVAPPPFDDTITLIFADPTVQNVVTNVGLVSNDDYYCQDLLIDTTSGDFTFETALTSRNGTVDVIGGGDAYVNNQLLIGSGSTVNLNGSDLIIGASHSGNTQPFGDEATHGSPNTIVPVSGSGNVLFVGSYGENLYLSGLYQFSQGIDLEFQGAWNSISISGEVDVTEPISMSTNLLVAPTSLVSSAGSNSLIIARGGGELLNSILDLQLSMQMDGGFEIGSSDLGLGLEANLSGTGSLNITSGSILYGAEPESIATPVFVDLGASVIGAADYKENAIINGDLDPGDQSFGTVAFDDLELGGTSTTCIEVGEGPTQNTATSDRVLGENSNATASIGGTLVIALADHDNNGQPDYLPDRGDELFIFEDIAINGVFDEIIYQNVNCEIEYGHNFIRLFDFRPFTSPSTYTVEVGTAVGGSLTAARVSNDQTLQIKQADLLPPFLDDGVRVVFNSNLVENDPGALELRLESSADSEGLIQEIECWDWTTSDWTEVHQTTKTEKLGVDAPDSAIIVSLTDDIEQFVSPTGQVSVRAIYRKDPGGYNSQTPWTISIDQIALGVFDN